MNEIGHGTIKAFLDVTQCTLVYLYARTQTFSKNVLLLILVQLSWRRKQQIAAKCFLYIKLHGVTHTRRPYHHA